jgi:hypothetical protein
MIIKANVVEKLLRMLMIYGVKYKNLSNSKPTTKNHKNSLQFKYQF